MSKYFEKGNIKIELRYFATQQQLLGNKFTDLSYETLNEIREKIETKEHFTGDIETPNGKMNIELITISVNGISANCYWTSAVQNGGQILTDTQLNQALKQIESCLK